MRIRLSSVHGWSCWPVTARLGPAANAGSGEGRGGGTADRGAEHGAAGEVRLVHGRSNAVGNRATTRQATAPRPAEGLPDGLEAGREHVSDPAGPEEVQPRTVIDHRFSLPTARAPVNESDPKSRISGTLSACRNPPPTRFGRHLPGYSTEDVAQSGRGGGGFAGGAAARRRPRARPERAAGGRAARDSGRRGRRVRGGRRAGGSQQAVGPARRSVSAAAPASGRRWARRPGVTRGARLRGVAGWRPACAAGWPAARGSSARGGHFGPGASGRWSGGSPRRCAGRSPARSSSTREASSSAALRRRCRAAQRGAGPAASALT